MRMDLCAWLEVEAYLRIQQAVVVPIGSTVDD